MKYSDRPHIRIEAYKREVIEAAIALTGWNVIYRDLVARGIEMLRWDGKPGFVVVTLRPDYRPTMPGWKLAAYDALFNHTDEEVTQLCNKERDRGNLQRG